jgi:hypothetical protein
MRMCTAPQDGASGASTSLTPSPATTFLLDLWTRPSTDAARLNRLSKLREFNSEEAQDTCLEGWSEPGLRGWNYADIVDALGAYTACDTRLSSRLISASGTLSPSVADRYQLETIGTWSF